MENDVSKIMDKIRNGRQYRNIVEMKIDDDDKKTVCGYATTFDEPYTLCEFNMGGCKYTFKERVDKEAFKECDMSDVIMQYDHQGRVFARQSNNTLELTVDEHGLFVTADLAGTEIGRDLYEEIKGGYTNKMSFGFTVTEDSEEVTENNDTGAVEVLRTIKRIGKLYDVSAVSLPANDGTEISARSYCNGVIERLEAERLQKEKIESQRKKIRILIEM